MWEVKISVFPLNPSFFFLTNKMILLSLWEPSSRKASLNVTFKWLTNDLHIFFSHLLR